ncbi:MAG: hypothetical protein R6W70_10095 [bacterium]
MNNNLSERNELSKMKKTVKVIWEDLTEEDFNKADGSMFKLYGIIRVKFGDTGKIIKETADSTNHN